MGQNFWVSPHDGKWGVRGEGNEKFSKLFDRQVDAIEYARQRAIREQSEAIVQGRNGRIRSKDSYGVDNCPPKDREH